MLEHLCAMPHIALVDNQILLRDLLREHLQRSNVGTIAGCASCIQEGLPLCTNSSVDMLIVNWQLDDGTGLDLIRQLGPHAQRLRMIVLTPSEQEGVVRTAAENGVHGVVSKRQPLPVLLEAIHVVSSGKCFYCPSSSKMLLDAMKAPSTHNTASLTPREWQILRAIGEGYSTREMARRLHISPKTIANHTTSLKDKLGIQEAAGLVRLALKHGLVELP